MTSKQILQSKYYNPDRSYVYFDISINYEYIGRISFELFDDIVPQTATNFRYLCTGEKVSKNEHKLFYKGCKFHRIVPGKIVQGGDITRGDGRGGQSIWHEDFADENFEVKHFKAGMLSMANKGPDTNSSQFFITLDNTFWYDSKHVVFGQMTEGKNVLEKLEALGSESGKPSKIALIEHCGLLSEAKNKIDFSKH
mmetsp:Transcript_80/g.70  ORF Transcript_80/g.70 Transcript_80/m.70 type:complete len:196 (+) Transcript_80:1-588(+)